MNPMTKIALAAALALPMSAAFADAHSEVDLTAVPSGAYQSDPTHSYITFSYVHLGLSEPVLAFDDFTIDMNLDTENVTASTIEMTIDPGSIVAGSDIWKEHLTGEDFFDVANNPEITFVSTGVSEGGDGAYKVDGDLTIKGETQPVSLSITVNAAMDHPMSGDPVIGISGSGEVMRSAFGLDTAVPHVSDEVQIMISSELIHAG